METTSEASAEVGGRREIRRAFEERQSTAVASPGVRLVVDGAVPFLAVVRAASPSDPVARLVRGEASYLVAGPEAGTERLQSAVRAVTEAGAETHGAFLVVEVWEGDDLRVLGPDGPAPATVQALKRGLEGLGPGEGGREVEVVATDHRHPPGQDPLLTVSECHELGALLVGVQVEPTWRDSETGDLFPLFLRRLAHGFSTVLRNAAFEFVRVQTGAELSSYRALGRRTLGEAVWEADRRLAEIDGCFDPLLLVAPVNSAAAWERFRDSRYEREPEFRYRLLPIDPDLLKRELYEVRLEDVEDPAAWRLLRDKREELDRQISLVADRNSPHFIHSSIRLFGPVDDALRHRAKEVLSELPPPGRAPRRERVGARAFAELAHAEFDYYRGQYPQFDSEVQIRPDLVGLMVSSGRLLVGRDLSLDPGRVEALLQHEVGTHVLTYVNGAAQPFLQLAHGFADYDELQEGLGVLAEYLVGGLNTARMRLLAARVVAVDACMAGATFIETFRRLHRDHGFSAGTAFGITARVYQGGGFTRDLIYLRGLLQVIEYLRDGGELEPLYVGKIAARHIDVIGELRERGVLQPVPLLPRFFDRDDVQDRLTALRDGLPLHAMTSDGRAE